MGGSLSVVQMLGLIGAAIVFGAALVVLALAGLAQLENRGPDLGYNENPGLGCAIFGLVLVGMAAFIAFRVLIVG